MKSRFEPAPYPADCETPAAVTELRGSLAQISLASLLQLLSSLEASGLLRLWRGDWAAELALENGRVVTATAASERGCDALEFVVLAIVEGEFAFVAGSPPGGADHDQMLHPQLLQLLTAHDNAPRAAATLSTAVPRLVDSVANRSASTELRLRRGALGTLLAIDGQRTIGEIAAARGHLRAIRDLITLDELALITCDDEPSTAGTSLMPPLDEPRPASQNVTPLPPTTPSTGDDDDLEALVAAAPAVAMRQIFRRFWPYARPYRLWIGLSLLFVLATPAVDTVTIWLYKLLVDDVLVPGNFDRFGRIALAYLGLTVLAGMVSLGEDLLSTWVGERFLLSLRASLFRHVLDLPLDFFERRRLGDILSRLTDDIASIETFVVGGVADVLAYGLSVVFFVGALFYIQWQLALLSLVVVPVFWLLAHRFSERIKDAARERRRRSGSLTSVAEESLANTALVQAYNRQAVEADRFTRQALGGFRAQLAATRLRALFTPLVDLVELGGVLLVIGAGTWALSQHQVSLGGLLVFLAYLAHLYSPIRALSKFSNTLHSAAAAAERVLELLDSHPEVVDRPDAIALRRARGLVVFDSVSFVYPGAARPALSNVSFRLEPGETLAVVGPSGAGKSTIAKLLLRFYDPTTGRVLIDGRDASEITLASLRENVAVLLQETLIFNGTVRENIAYGRMDATEAEIVAAARAADAHNFVTRLPHGYDTVIGERGRSLSGGQRQRIAIARAMIRQAAILVLDEPTTGLDTTSGQRILGPLTRLMRGRASIVISHDLLTARQASRILVLEDGQAVEQGTHDELLRRGGTYARMYGTRQAESALSTLEEVAPA